MALKICEIFVVIEALRAECGVNEETCVTVISQNANDIVLNRSHGVDASCLDCFHMPNECINGHTYTRASPHCNNAITYMI